MEDSFDDVVWFIRQNAGDKRQSTIHLEAFFGSFICNNPSRAHCYLFYLAIVVLNECSITQLMPPRQYLFQPMFHVTEVW
jgi:hypothetical protein